VTSVSTRADVRRQERVREAVLAIRAMALASEPEHRVGQPVSSVNVVRSITGCPY